MGRVFGLLPLLKTLIVAGLIGPAAGLALSAWLSYHDTFGWAERALVREVGLMTEHALRVFDSYRVVAARAADLLHDQGFPQVRDERTVHEAFQRFVAGLPQMYSIWAFDAAGRLVATSAVYPVPRQTDFSDRDYFMALRDQPLDLFVSEIGLGRVDGALFFSIALPIRGDDGRFAGAIAVSGYPSYFTDVFARMLERPDETAAALLREDGAFLARFPAAYAAPLPPFPHLSAESGLMRAIRHAPEGGTYIHATREDGERRLFAYRRLEGLPVYVVTARSMAGIVADWRAEMVPYVPLTVAAMALLSGLAWVALHRARREQQALDRLRREALQRAAAERALGRAQRLEAMGQLTGGVAHDFNNLLQVIASSMVLLRRPLAEDMRHKVLASVDQAVESGRALIGQLMAFARRQPVAPTVVRLNIALERLRDLLRHSLGRSVRLVVELPDTVAPVRVDQGALELALLNLAVNARDAMNGAGTVTIRVAEEDRTDADADGPAGAFVALSVRDTGCGIPPDLLDKVLEPFFTTKGSGRGTGLGLSQVYGFVTQAGGFVSIVSALGNGTTITLHLPRLADHGAAGQLPPPAAAVPTAGDGPPLRVLVVEDDPDIRETTCDTFRHFGHSVRAAPGAREALELLQDHPEDEPDVVFSDIMMAGAMNGLDLARQVREVRPGLPVILATGYSTSAELAEAEGFPVLRKPYEVEDAIAVARRLIAGAAEE